MHTERKWEERRQQKSKAFAQNTDGLEVWCRFSFDSRLFLFIVNWYTLMAWRILILMYFGCYSSMCLCVSVCAPKEWKPMLFFHSLSVYRKVYINYMRSQRKMRKKKNGTKLMKCECKANNTWERIPEVEVESKKTKRAKKIDVFFLLFLDGDHLRREKERWVFGLQLNTSFVCFFFQFSTLYVVFPLPIWARAFIHLFVAFNYTTFICLLVCSEKPK